MKTVKNEIKSERITTLKQQSEFCKEFIKLYMHALSIKRTSSGLT